MISKIDKSLSENENEVVKKNIKIFFNNNNNKTKETAYKIMMICFRIFFCFYLFVF